MTKTKKENTEKTEVVEETVKKTKKAEKAEDTESKIEDKKEKLAKLIKERSKQLVEEVKEEKVDLKSKVKTKKQSEDEAVEKKDALVPMDDYLKASIHLGTRVITPDMRALVYRRRADGLAVFNTALLDDKIREGAEFLAQYAPEDIVIVCKREAGWKAVEKFAKTLGIRSFTKKYPAGVLTNTSLDNFMEAELVLICDPWLDKNALEDANRIKIPVLSICDTNNFTKGITKIVPGNNKSAKSLGMILYLLTKIYAEKRKLDVKVPSIAEFIDDWENLTPPK